MVSRSKIYNPKSLFDLSCTSVQKTYQHHWNEVNILPVFLQHLLLRRWLQCEESIPIEDDWGDEVCGRLKDEWADMLPICNQTFVDLMSHPICVPRFADDRNHIHFDFVEQLNALTMKVIGRYCTLCYSVKSKFYKPFSANWWYENNWIWREHKSHRVVSGEDLLEDVIWIENNWCSVCITTPLFNIMSGSDCAYDDSEYYCHSRKRLLYESSSSSDSEHAITRLKVIPGNKINDVMYHFIKKNKDAWS